MLIVSYDEKYKQDIIEIVGNFYEEALKEYSAPIDHSVLLQTIEKYKDTAFLLIINDKCEGVIAGTMTQSPLNSEKVFQEFIWFINPAHRLKGVLFLRKVEQLLKEQGYAQLVMALMANSKAEKIAALYERMNFKLFESHYIKNL